MVRTQSYLWILTSFGNTFSVNNDESYLRGQDDSFGNTLLKIEMTHPLSGLRVCTLTINSGDVPLHLGHVRAFKIGKGVRDNTCYYL